MGIDFAKSFSFVPFITGLGVVFAAFFAQTSSSQTLRELASKQEIFYGAAVGEAFWGPDSLYRETLRRECNIIVAENEMKFSLIEPQRGVLSWSKADDLVSFAEKNKMKIRGHNLVWHAQSEWASELNAGRDEMIVIMREHIHKVVGRYKGKIYEWDVVNEAIDDGDGFFRDTFWKRTIGEDYIDLAFKFAHEADPQALLFYNDYGAEDMGKKSEKVYQLVSGMIKRGIPVHGVGLQCHFTLGEIDTAGIDTNIKRLAKLGLKVSVTELDIRMQLPATPAMLEQQGKEYEALMRVFLNNPSCCTSFLTWGINDKYSWIPWFFKGYGAALPFDDNYKPKPACQGLKNALMAR
jgi:endo-1,4-beta-xylanase